jgi:hypothetical protein
VINALANLSIIAVVPWQEAMQSKFIAAQFMEKLYGTRAAGAVTVLVLRTALASVFALPFGYSRIPYAAALNGDFFSWFGKLHRTGRFPYVSLLVIGGLSIAASMWDLDAVISALLTSRVLVQFLAQIAAFHVAIPAAQRNCICVIRTTPGSGAGRLRAGLVELHGRADALLAIAGDFGIGRESSRDLPATVGMSRQRAQVDIQQLRDVGHGSNVQHGFRPLPRRQLAENVIERTILEHHRMLSNSSAV